jgi:uncharacterized protein YcfJ
VRLKLSNNEPKRGSKVKATASLRSCGGHSGTRIMLQRKRSGVFKTVKSKPIGDTCKATFTIRAKFKQATFRSHWPQQDEDHAAGSSKPKKITTRRS